MADNCKTAVIVVLPKMSSGSQVWDCQQTSHSLRCYQVVMYWIVDQRPIA